VPAIHHLLIDRFVKALCLEKGFQRIRAPLIAATSRCSMAGCRRVMCGWWMRAWADPWSPGLAPAGVACTAPPARLRAPSSLRWSVCAGFYG